jgi:hypothetical protein
MNMFNPWKVSEADMLGLDPAQIQLQIKTLGEEIAQSATQGAIAHARALVAVSDRLKFLLLVRAQKEKEREARLLNEEKDGTKGRNK